MFTGSGVYTDIIQILQCDVRQNLGHVMDNNNNNGHLIDCACTYACGFFASD